MTIQYFVYSGLDSVVTIQPVTVRRILVAAQVTDNGAMSKLKTTPTCPCGGASYASCCSRYIDSATPAPTAEALMRSRYSAYT